LRGRIPKKYPTPAAKAQRRAAGSQQKPELPKTGKPAEAAKTRGAACRPPGKTQKIRDCAQELCPYRA